MVGFSDQGWNGIPLPMKLGVIGLGNCQWLVSPDVLDDSHASATGTGGYGYAIPGGPSFAGFTIHGRWFVANPPSASTPYALTNGVHVVFH